MQGHPGARGATVLVINDVAPVLRIIELELRVYGYNVAGISIDERVFELIGELKPDVIVMEVFLPQMRGMELLRGIRQRWDTPVIFLTTSDNEADREEALALGASDYILKPFEPAELTHRISSLLQAPSPPALRFRAGDVVVDFGRRELTVGRRRISPTTSEWALLFALGRAPRIFVPAEEVLLQVWGLEGVLNRSSLAEWVDRLRDRLGDPREAPRIIRGDMQQGYMLDAREA